jgi:hypothetical protein
MANRAQAVEDKALQEENARLRALLAELRERAGAELERASGGRLAAFALMVHEVATEGSTP